MKNVTVYRCGKVFADGVQLTNVRSVEPPTHLPKGNEMLGSIALDITGTLTYSPLTREKACGMDATPAPPLPSINSDQLQRFYDAGKIDYPAYAALMKAMKLTPCMSPPSSPVPMHPDTQRVAKVRERIDKLYKEGMFSYQSHQHLIDALV